MENRKMEDQIWGEVRRRKMRGVVEIQQLRSQL